MTKPDTIEREEQLKSVKDKVEDYLTKTTTARSTSEQCRDYKDGVQWTTEEIAMLAKRRQAPIVINRVKPKVEGLLGLVSMRRTDPKAFPRTKKHEKTADCITDSLNYVTDNNDFQNTKMDVCEDFFVEGTGGVIVDVSATPDDNVEIRIAQIPWDRLVFDPHSRKKDFSDSRYMGLILWMDADEAKEKFPDIDIDLLIAGNKGDDSTIKDRPQWVDGKNKRIRVCQLFYIVNGKWNMCFFTEGEFLVEPDLSPYLDEFSEPCNPIELVCAYIDRQNNRYGEVLSFLDPQDEINHRRSKALHLLSQRQTASRQGALKDIAAMKREMSKPDGHVEYTGEKGDFEVLQTSDMARGQFELYQDAKAELDAVSFNAQLSGERQSGDLSGRAIDKLQSAGTIELNGLFATLNGWEKRVYRQCWARIKQFWTKEKWIRVTDDIDNLRWVGINTEVTAQEWLEEQINDESKPLHVRQAAAASYTALMQAQSPALQQVIEVKNDVTQLDVDIILDQTFDTVNVQQEQFELLAKFAQSGDIDIIELIELSSIRGKDEIIERIEKRRKEAQDAQQGMLQAQQQKLEADIAEKQTKAQLHTANAQHLGAKSGETVTKTQTSGVDVALKAAQLEQTQVETRLMLKYPPQKTQLQERT